jgi:hypothetical protein
LLAATALLVSIASSSVLSLQKRAKPLDRQEVAQAWVGLSEDELLFLRLDLNDDGSGLGCYLSIDNEGHPFKITSWTYEWPRINFRLASASTDKPFFDKLSGMINGHAMDLTMSGSRFETRISLRREDELVAKWETLRSIIDALKADAHLHR